MVREKALTPFSHFNFDDLFGIINKILIKNNLSTIFMQFFISLRTKIIIAIIILAGFFIILSMIKPSPAPETSIPEVSIFYVKEGGANVRECLSITCKVVGTFSQGTDLSFPGDLYDKYPDWAEITFSDGQVGYISKSRLSYLPGTAKGKIERKGARFTMASYR